MSPYADLIIEIGDRFVIQGRYREYLARIRTPSGSVLFSSGWDRSRKHVEERAKQFQRETERHDRRGVDALPITHDQALACRIEIEEHVGVPEPLYFARVRHGEDGPVLFESGWHADALVAEQLARAYLHQLFRVALPQAEA